MFAEKTNSVIVSPSCDVVIIINALDRTDSNVVHPLESNAI
jgi:hypothetical protein